MREKYWWLTDESKQMLERGYLLPNQTVDEKLNSICKYAASFYKDEEGLKEKFLELFERGWCSLSSPIWANFGEDRGLPISCFNTYIPDSMDGIYGALHEVAMETKLGGGTSGYFKLRSIGSPIKGGGISSGLMSFVELFDTTTKVVSQAGVRRGAFAAYVDIEHPEIEKFLTVKDKQSSLQSINTGICVSDEWMKLMEDGDKEKREIWAKILKSRREKGIPYLFFSDTVNKNKPQIYKDTNSTIHSSNLCFVWSDRVVTSRGYLTAKELFEQGGTLELFNGEKIVNSSEMKLREQNVPVLKITLENGLEHTVTEYHGMAKYEGNGKIVRTPASELKIGDKLAIQTSKGLFGGVSMKDEAFLLGLYQSDGTQFKDLRFIDIWEKDFDLVEEIESKVETLYKKYGCDTYEIKNQTGLTGKFRKSKPPKFTNCGTGTSSVAKKRLGTNCFTKNLGFEKGYVPSWIWEATEETQWEYIRGLYFADGTVTLGKGKGEPIYLSYTDINLGFLKELQLLLNNLGLQSSIKIQREEGLRSLPDGKGSYKMYPCKTAYRLLIGNKNSALDFEKNTGFLSRKGVFIDEREYRDNTKKSSKIISIELIGAEDVYCPTVYNDEHIFIVNGMKTFNCNEIYLPTSETESFVCCLLSMNLFTYDEWENTDAVKLAVMFLDAVMSDFIKKVKDIPSMYKTYNFAKRHRALGLGVMGWHSLLQQKMIPFESFEAQQLNTSIFKYLKENSYKASIEIGDKYGHAPIFDEVETSDIKRRNTTLLALAPTTSSSSILGQVSPSVEPYASNYFVAGLAKGSFTRKNLQLENLLINKNKNTEDVWKSIIQNQGSVQHLDFLTDREKEVFKTFQEISPFTIIQQASARQYFIDQGQSINLKIPNAMSIRDVNKVHMEAWKLGLKGLYYQRGTSVAKEAVLSMMECKSCEA